MNTNYNHETKSLKDFYQVLILTGIVFVSGIGTKGMLLFFILIPFSLLFYNKISWNNELILIVKLWKKTKIKFEEIKLIHVRAAGSDGIPGTNYVVDLYLKNSKRKLRFANKKDVLSFLGTIKEKKLKLQVDGSILNYENQA